MKLDEQKFLFVDCQTTGIRPPHAQILELAWGWGSAQDAGIEIHSHLIRLADERELPRKIAELTGISEDELASDGVELRAAFENFKAELERREGVRALAHYAQFEKPFLHDLFATHEAAVPFELLCTQQLLKRLYPELPSFNIRAGAGFFGFPIDTIKRARSHVEATHRIWQGLVEQLKTLSIENEDEFQGWLKTKTATKAERYSYRMDRLKRLSLPDSPGVYRMLAKTGKILYVGKATSLKDRVNSYFRGRKGRDTRKLEMLAQVWDMRVTPCATPLEAALLESDEIKRHNPPYNIALKAGSRKLVFYNREFDSCVAAPAADHRLGPFRESNWIEHLRLIVRSIEQGEFEQIFFYEIPPEILKEGFWIFCREHGLEPEALRSTRCLLALGSRLPPIERQVEEISEEVSEDDGGGDDGATENEDPPTPEEVAAKFARLFRRAADEYWRSRKMQRLLNCRIEWQGRSLEFRHDPKTVWREEPIATFDRLSIVLSELARHPHRIQFM